MFVETGNSCPQVSFIENKIRSCNHYAASVCLCNPNCIFRKMRQIFTRFRTNVMPLDKPTFFYFNILRPVITCRKSEFIRRKQQQRHGRKCPELTYGDVILKKCTNPAKPIRMQKVILLIWLICGSLLSFGFELSK